MIDLSRRRILAAGLGVSTILFSGARALAQAEDAAIRPVAEFYDALLDAMRHAQALKVKGRYDRLEPTMTKSFDVPSMVRAAVGGAFNSLPTPDQASLRIAFGRLLVATFASTFDDFKGERFVVDPHVETRGGDRFVKTQFVGSGAPTDINYLVRDTGKEWRIVDVDLNGTISQLATWRSLYGTVLQNGGPQALLHAVDAQTAKFMAAI